MAALLLPCGTAAATDPGAPSDPQKLKLALIHKLESIKIPKVEFDQTRLADVIRFLTEEATAADPEKHGINFLLLPDPEISSETIQTMGDRLITLNLRDVTLLQLVKFVTQVTGLSYKIEPGVVAIGPKPKGSGAQQTRTFNIPPGLFPTTKDRNGNKSSPSPGSFPSAP